jgi:CheY-like chemotaxis protein
VQLPIAVVNDGFGPKGVHPPGSDSIAMQIDAVDLSGLSILVVEDEADARNLVARVLEETGAEVRTVGAGADALAAIAADQPSLVVTDIGMPVMDGYELIQRIRALPPAAGGHVPIIALTAFARSEDRTRSLLAGCQAHLTKPVDSSELVATVVAVTRGATRIRG